MGFMRGTARALLLATPAFAITVINSSSTASSTPSTTISTNDSFSQFMLASTTISTNDSFSQFTLASTGSGSAYASSCAYLYSSYSSAFTSWSQDHQTVEYQTQVYGGTVQEIVTYYENATTLCDGVPRVTYSPAIALSTGTITSVDASVTTSVQAVTGFSEYPSASPSCSISPSDCDPLWLSYSSALTAWDLAESADTANAAQVTAAPMTPPCYNSSEASSVSAADTSIYGCGVCTIYGQGVQLVYFPEPTTVSRDMCASTPLASLTNYGAGAVIEAYAGSSDDTDMTATSSGAVTVVYDGHTFTSGTAYISIESVWAENRCFSTIGTQVNNAVLAMPSESVLSLRYSQDHFQYFIETSVQTGYPVSYADFNKPIPWSAWNGQANCLCPETDCGCDLIYENQYRPQLAIPPGIKKLNSDWQDCQMWYGGLYDPPMALTYTTLDLPTPVVAHASTTTDPSPASTATTTWATETASATVLTTEDSTTASSTVDQTTQTSVVRDTGSSLVTQKKAFAMGSRTYTAAVSGDVVSIGSETITSGGAAQTIDDGVVASYGASGLIIGSSSTVVLAASNTDGTQTVASNTDGTQTVAASASQTTSQITIDGTVYTVSAISDSADPVAFDSTTLTPGGVATTLTGGQVVSAVTNGLVYVSETTLGLNDAVYASIESSSSSTVAHSEADASFTSSTTSSKNSATSSKGGAALSRSTDISVSVSTKTGHHTSTTATAALSSTTTTKKSSGNIFVVPMGLIIGFITMIGIGFV